MDTDTIRRMDRATFLIRNCDKLLLTRTIDPENRGEQSSLTYRAKTGRKPKRLRLALQAARKRVK